MLNNIFNYFARFFDPESAHKLAIKFFKQKNIPFNFFKCKKEQSLKIKVFGINFENPIGLAAGFDKNAEVYNTMYSLGFSFVEVGTVTPKSQNGNAKPRVFRLNDDEAIINRLGFPNEGMEKIYERINENPKLGVLGVNIGPNKENATDQIDYLKCMKKFYNRVDYIAINISSPNTPNLRKQHEIKKITDLIKILQIYKSSQQIAKPIIFKLSPNLNNNEIDRLSDIFLEKKIDGIILTNTTITGKEHLLDKNKNEEGGLSGKPLSLHSNIVIQSFYKNLRGKIPIVGVGGVHDGKTAYEKIKCGANLLQLYTAMVFRGPYVASKINRELVCLLKKDGLKNISDAIGVNAK